MTKQEKRFGNAMNCPCGNTLTDENLLEDGKCADGKKWCDTCVLNGACSCDIHTGTTPDWIGIIENRIIQEFHVPEGVILLCAACPMAIESEIDTE